MFWFYAGDPTVKYEMDEKQQKLMLDILDMDGTDVAVVEFRYTRDGVAVNHLAQFRQDPYDPMWAEEVVKTFPTFVMRLVEEAGERNA
jgi:hypothetical protein